MGDKIIKIWEPVSFNENWLNVDTSLFDELAPSWYQKREEFKEGNKDYEDFLNKLKRQHAIETGILEKLYDLNEGITQTFIKEGFIENYISHGDTDIPSSKLIGYLNSHFEAMDFVFDLVKNNISLTKSFILELHQLLLKHQNYTTAIDSLGRVVQVNVLKGKFKEHPNNPKRDDGTVFEYCPPIHVDTEMENLIKIHNELENKKTHPIILAAWFHHAFTQIHPFQDGNGRMARLLTSLILIKHQLFPLNVLRNEKPEYIKALEDADNKKPENLVKLFCKIQRRNIESALNIQTRPDTLLEVAEIFKEKVKKITTQKKKEEIEKNRESLSSYVHSVIGKIQEELYSVVPKDQIHIQSISSTQDNYYYYTKQIIDYANEHNYFFNKNLERKWHRISFHVLKNKRYDIVITIHHFGYLDSVMAIGAFIEFVEFTDKGNYYSVVIDDEKERKITQTISLNIKPYTISLEEELTTASKKNIEEYLKDIFKIGMSIIINEIS